MKCKLCNQEMMVVGAGFSVFYRGSNHSTDSIRCSAEGCYEGYEIVVRGPLKGRKFMIVDKKLKEIK